MKIEKKENYTLITSDEDFFENFHTNFKNNLQLENKNIIIQLSEKLNITEKNILLFLTIAKAHKKNGTSFAIVYTDVIIDNFPEDFNIAPTLKEAEDILEMEAIERDLGF